MKFCFEGLGKGAFLYFDKDDGPFGKWKRRSPPVR